MPSPLSSPLPLPLSIPLPLSMALSPPCHLPNPNVSRFPPSSSLSLFPPSSLRTVPSILTVHLFRTAHPAVGREFSACAQDSSPRERFPPEAKHGGEGFGRGSGEGSGRSSGEGCVRGLWEGSGVVLAAEGSEKVRRKAWECIKGCGACCQLDKGPGAPPIEDILKNPEELELYKSMVGPDGWCVNYNKTSRTCSIYEDRPRFCRVEPSVFWDLFGIEEEYMDEEACNFCTDTIRDVYGGRSKEIKSFNKTIRDLKKSQKEQNLQKPHKSKLKK